MAIFSKKTEDEAKQVVEAGEIAVTTAGLTVAPSHKGMIVAPRLSEKASSLAPLNKYVFKVTGGKANKIEIRQAIEKFYGVKVDSINSINVKGKYRKYGRSFGKMSNFKKVVVTLTKDSKVPDIAEIA
jgi:large subunit ribosomal protein L23